MKKASASSSALITGITLHYLYMTVFHLEYIHIKLPDSTKIFIAGPFSFERFTNQRILDLCSYNSVPPQYNEFMQLYYSALPVFADERCISAIIICLCSKLWGNNYTIEKHVLNKNSTPYMYKEKAPEPTKIYRSSGNPL